MIELRVTLPEWAAEYIQEQISAGRWRSADHLLTDLFDRARTVELDDRLAESILEGENSGGEVRFTEEWWEEKRLELLAEAERRRSA